MARVVSIYNQKGGVGKTTTAVNLSAYLAHLGKKSLLIDFDPQANATSGFGVVPNLEHKSIYHGILGQNNFEDIFWQSSLRDHHLIPANQNLAGAAVELVNMPEREYYLRKFINKIRHNYDYVIVDLAPSLSLLTINGLVASDEVLIPVQAEYYSLEGLGQLLETINLINKNLGRQIKVAGALITMYDNKEKFNREVSENVRNFFPRNVYATEIPRCVALAEAPSFGKPIMFYKPDSLGAKAYEQLAREVIEQEIKNEG